LTVLKLFKSIVYVVRIDTSIANCFNCFTDVFCTNDSTTIS